MGVLRLSNYHIDGYEVELTGLDNADAVVAVEDNGDIIDEDDALTTTGQVEEFNEDADTLQAIRFQSGEDESDLSDSNVEDQTSANAIIENLD